jgi:Asp-tRNA(Asn)/Glu-tRNA(Gln) amidotransferase A subunit family amidase
MDAVGPLGVCVQDIEYVDSIVTGERISEEDTLKPKDIRIGIPKECFFENLDPLIEKAALRAIDNLRKAGFVIVEGDSIKNV